MKQLVLVVHEVVGKKMSTRYNMQCGADVWGDWIKAPGTSTWRDPLYCSVVHNKNQFSNKVVLVSIYRIIGGSEGMMRDISRQL